MTYEELLEKHTVAAYKYVYEVEDYIESEEARYGTGWYIFESYFLCYVEDHGLVTPEEHKMLYNRFFTPERMKVVVCDDPVYSEKAYNGEIPVSFCTIGKNNTLKWQDGGPHAEMTTYADVFEDIPFQFEHGKNCVASVNPNYFGVTPSDVIKYFESKGFDVIVNNDDDFWSMGRI